MLCIFYALAVMDFSFVSSDVGIPFATNVGALTVTRCESAAKYVCALATLMMCAVRFLLMCSYPSSYTVSGSLMPRLLSLGKRLCECMFQPTVAASVSRQTMPAGGVSITKCAVVLLLPALMKQTGFRLVCGIILMA